ncbi:ABC transporter permease [Heliomicrobium gestii]|nr:ABC transporter permease [Heliomicrobium gestii]MBM7865568.1 molybdate transport system permease protein [Heliomicrobium gestii]
MERSFRLIFVLMTGFMAAVFGVLLLYGQPGQFREVIANPEFQFAALFTLGTTVLATVAAVLAAIPCGFVLARHSFPGKALLDTLLDLPIVLPPLVSGVALLILFGPVLGNGLSRLGQDVVFTARGVVIAQWFIATPFAIKTFSQAFAAIDPRYEKVARTLGHTSWQTFYRVTLPMARKGILGGVAMTWARTLGEFGATAMLAGVTRMKTETLSAAVYLSVSVGDLPFALTTATVLWLAALTVLVIFRGVTGAGMRT